MNNRNLTAIFLGMATLALLIGVLTVGAPMASNNGATKAKTIQPQQVNQILPKSTVNPKSTTNSIPKIDTNDIVNKANDMDKNIKQNMPNNAKIDTGIKTKLDTKM